MLPTRPDYGLALLVDVPHKHPFPYHILSKQRLNEDPRIHAIYIAEKDLYMTAVAYRQR